MVESLTGELHKYGLESAEMMGLIIKGFLDRNIRSGTNLYQQYILQKGLRKFGDRGMTGVTKEVQQLHNRGCFKPLLPNDISDSELRKTVRALIFLAEKKDLSIKGRMVYDRDSTKMRISIDLTTTN